MASVIVLLGAPGAGKGTQAVRLSERCSLPHVATGDLFRAHLKEGTELGHRAKRFMESGKLVPDEIVLDMLFDRVQQLDCAEGYLLDGFPRTLAQARALDERLGEEDRLQVLDLEVPDEAIVERAAGRLLCRDCGAIYHVDHSPPKREGECDACSGELYQRDDDSPEVVRERLEVYHAQTEPVVRHYDDKGVLQKVDGDRSPDAVERALLAAISSEG